MNTENLKTKEEVKEKNKEILLKVALLINKELFDENEISYKIYKYTEESILKDLKKERGE